MNRHRLDGSFAWTGQRFEATDRWRFELIQAEVDDLERAVETAQAAGRCAHDIGHEYFPLPVLGPKLAAIADELENGCGVVRVFGLPIERYDEPTIELRWMGIGRHLGALRDQDPHGQILEPGEMQILNNHVVYHARDAYEDCAEPDGERLLYRLWICPPVNRALPHKHEVLWGNTEANSLRGGIPRSI